MLHLCCVSPRQGNIENNVNLSPEDTTFQELNIIMYINSIVGLVIRDSPNIDGEIVAFLDYSTEIFAIKKGENDVYINGIKCNWIYISYENIEGWVLDIHLSLIKPISEQSENIYLIIDDPKIIPEPKTEYRLRDITEIILRDFNSTLIN
jgi:hypothetical protein